MGATDLPFERETKLSLETTRLLPKIQLATCLLFLFWDRVFLIAQDGPKFTILLSPPPSAGMTGTHHLPQPNQQHGGTRCSSTFTGCGKRPAGGGGVRLGLQPNSGFQNPRPWASYITSCTFIFLISKWGIKLYWAR